MSSRDFERLLSYMYHGEVSVPQSELLSLIAAARSLGIRGLAEESLGEAGREARREAGRANKREGEPGEVGPVVGKKPRPSCPKLQPKPSGGGGAGKVRSEEGDSEGGLQDKVQDGVQEGGVGGETEENSTALRPHDDNIARGQQEGGGRGQELRAPRHRAGKEKGGSGKEEEEAASPKTFPPFFEVTVKQEEEEEVGGEDSIAADNAGEPWLLWLLSV